MRVSVLGPESTGTKLMVRVLAAAGAETQHRSFPYGYPGSVMEERRWPEREVEGFWPHAVVVMQRDWWAASRSQVAEGYVANETEAFANIRGAIGRISDLCRSLHVPYYVISYESLVQRPVMVISNLCDALGLPVPQLDEEVVDANEKHLGQVTA